ncbi:MAG: hypothetical protein NZM31_00400 [Gemmatales bacterium]|nr:hypothetical protein [Gemmatales bacterium]MDW8385453.1 hypothetical protein [Gemmatales bacterium]
MSGHTSFRSFVSVAAVLLAALSSAYADDAVEARKIIERAIEASGMEKFAKDTGTTLKGKGTLNLMGAMVPFTMTGYFQMPDKSRGEIHIDVMGQQLEIINIFNKDKGWVKIADNVIEMAQDQIDEAKDSTYNTYITSLLPLREPTYQLSTLGTTKENGMELVGVLVKAKDKPDVKLWFDSKTRLLVKTQMKTKDGTTGQEVNEESYLSDYRNSKGAKIAFKYKTLRDGKVLLEAELESWESVPKHPDSLFEKP